MQPVPRSLILMTVVPALVLALIAATPLSGSINQGPYRALASLVPDQWYAVEGKVGLLQLDRSHWEAGSLNWSDIAARLDQVNAKAVAVLSPYQLDALPDEETSGWIRVVPDWVGVTVNPGYSASDKSYLALRRALEPNAAELPEQAPPAPSFDFLWDHVVRVNGTDLLSSEASSRLLADRWVMVVARPLATGETNVARFHAERLMAEASGLQETVPPGWLRALLVAVWMTAVMLAFRQAPIRLRAPVLVGFLMGAALFSAVLFYLLQLRLPLLELLGSAMAAPFFLSLVNHWQLRENVSDSVDRKRGALEHHISRSTAVESDSFWAQIARMVQQTLNLERVIFLELPAGARHVHEVVALNCSIDDIAERRRDIGRTPYSTAVDENRPLRLDYHYLLSAGEDEHQYLIALVFAGELVGFVAAGVKPSSIDDEAAFLNQLEQFTDAIAEMQHVRRSRQGQALDLPTRLRSWLATDQAGDLMQLHDSVEQSLLRRLGLLESAMDSMATAAALFDIFGNVLVVNRSMSAFMRERQIDAFDTTVTQLLCELCGCDLKTARRKVRHALLSQRQSVLPVAVPDSASAKTLHLRPVDAAEQTVGFDVSALHTHGLLIEIEDHERNHLLNDVARQYSKRVVSEFRNYVTAAVVAGELLSDDRLSAEKRSRVLATLRKKVDGVIASGKTLEATAEMNLHSIAGQGLPVDPLEILDRVLAQVKPLADARSVALSVHVPRLVTLIVSDADHLRRLLRLTLEYLIDDCASESSVAVSVETRAHQVVITLKASGFGMPAESLNALIAGKVSASSQRLKQLQGEADYVRETGGEIEVDSQVGQGTVFSLRFKTFSFGDADGQ